MNRTTMRREQRAFALLLLDRACTGRSDPRSARNRYAAAGAFSVHDRSNDQVARSFLALTSVTGRHKLRPSGTSPPTERRLSIRPSSGRPLLQVRVLRRRPEWLRSLQGRVTIATSAPKHRMVSVLTDKRLEYCTAGAPIQGSCATKSKVQADKHGISGVFRLDSARVATRGDRHVAQSQRGSQPGRDPGATSRTARSPQTTLVRCNPSFDGLHSRA